MTIPQKEFFDRIAALGFNRIYCYVSSEAQLDGDFEDFIVEDYQANPTGFRIPVAV